ncbi:MAG: tetratricopeptide repeat protein, partial [Candidatus Obscuribacterales bacterium]|nr:tetratricopeptide repeat protein [Candidatus Obscuribacterales bacterium]
MLPPKDVPRDLRFKEYLKLLMRYQVLEWHRQIAAATTKIVETQPQSRLSQDGQKRLAALMRGLEGVVLVKDSTEELTSAACTLVKATATRADNFMDRFESVKKAKDGILSAFTVLTDSVKDTVDKAIENHVLPAVGLPLYELPTGKLPDEYLHLARRYEFFGLPEGARDALAYVIEVFPDTPEAVTAKRRLKSRIPKKRVSEEAQRQFFVATRCKALQQKDKAKEIYEKLVLTEPDFDWAYAMLAICKLKEGDLERARDLIAMGRKLNQNSAKVESAQAAID